MMHINYVLMNLNFEKQAAFLWLWNKLNKLFKSVLEFMFPTKGRANRIIWRKWFLLPGCCRSVNSFYTLISLFSRLWRFLSLSKPDPEGKDTCVADRGFTVIRPYIHSQNFQTLQTAPVCVLNLNTQESSWSVLFFAQTSKAGFCCGVWSVIIYIQIHKRQQIYAPHLKCTLPTTSAERQRYNGSNV